MPDDTRAPQNADLKGLPAAVPEDAGLTGLMNADMPPALRLWLDDRMFNRARLIASYIAKADGVTPKHLLNKPEACFAVVEIALTWRMSPSAVARCTYQTPGGQLGYYGALCQAVLENSGKLEGGVSYEHYGEWSRVQGKFEMRTGRNDSRYPSPTYTEKDEEGVGVIVRAQVKGEVEPRELRFDLRQAFPRNSTLWATDPKTQIKYTAVRRFATSVAPGIFMGIPFDWEGDGDHMIDVTPPARPTREAFANGNSKEEKEAPAAASNAEAKRDTPAPTFDVTKGDGEVKSYKRASDAVSLMEAELRHAANISGDALQGVWESNGLILTQLAEREREPSAEMLRTLFRDLVEEIDKKERAKRDQAQQQTKQEPVQQQQQEPQRAAEPQAAQQAPAQQAQPAKPTVEPWTFSHPNYRKVPTSPLQGGNWIAFLPWMADQFRAMPASMFADFLSESKFGKEFDFIADRRKSDYDEMIKIAHDRGVNL